MTPGRKMALPKNLIGICGEVTTYRDDFRPHKVEKIGKKVRQDLKNVKPKKITFPVFAESHDTFQKLDLATKLPFDALWERKEIIGTDPRTPVHKNCQCKKNESVDVSSTKPKKLISPAVNLDDVKNPEIYKRVANYLYKSTVAQAADEVWRDLEKNNDKCMLETKFEASEDTVPLKMKRIPSQFENAGKKWDFSQSRQLINRKEKICPMQSVETRTNFVEKSEHRKAICELIEDHKKLRLPYEKLPLSYGGHRTSIALGVPLVKEKLSPYHPDLTVSQALASRHD